MGGARATTGWLIIFMFLILAGEACGPDSVSASGPVQADASAPMSAQQSALPAPTATVGGAVSAPFDVGAVMRQVHFAYREENDAFVAGHDTYTVRVADGAVVLRPYHHPDGEVIEGAPMTIRTAAVGRTLRARPLGAAARVFENGDLVIERDLATETLHNAEDGVQQSWSFHSPPTGSGDLAVRVAVSGLSYVGQTSLGLHFADPQTGLGFRYGNATWIDAKGVMLDVRPRWVGGEIVMTVPADVVDASAFPAVLDPVIGPELGVDNPTTAPGIWSSGRPEVGFDGTNWLVVWTDSRSGTTTDTYGARVNAAGAVLDTLGLLIATGRSVQGLAFDGTNYLVLLDSQGQFVSPAGTLVGGPFAIEGLVAGARVAFNGTQYLVVEGSASSSDPLRGVFVSKTGSVGSPFVIRTSSDARQSAAVACNASAVCLVVWVENGTLYGQRVASTGLTGGLLLVNYGDEYHFNRFANVIWGGGQFLVSTVAWVVDGEEETHSDLLAIRVSATGTVSLPASLYMYWTESANYGGAPAMGFDGTDYLVSFVSPSGTTHALRVSTGGLQVGSVINMGVPASSTHVKVAFGSTNYLFAYTTTWGTYAARLSKVPAVVDTPHILVSSVTNSQTGPAVGFDGVNYLVVWSDSRDARSQVVLDNLYGARVSKTGTVLDPSGLAISTGSGNQRLPSVAFDGTNYLVVWQDEFAPTNAINGVRVSKSGSVLDAPALALATSAAYEYRPKVAFDGTNYLVVWEANGDIMGRRISPSASALSTFTISSATGTQMNAAVAFGNPDYLVTWADDRSGNSDIYGTRVTTAGAVVDGATAGFAISNAPGNQETPDLAFDGTNFIVVWRDLRTTSPGIYGTRVSPAGTPLDGAAAGIAISTAAANQLAPRVAYSGDGSNFLVVWQDERSGTTATRPDIYGSWVTGAGTVLDPAGVAISVGSTPENAPALAADGSGGLLVAYEKKAVSAADHLTRVRARLITSDGLLGTSCTASAQCASRICKDGFCCENACTGSCQTCSATPGRCLTVTSAEDSDTCTGGSSCNSAGVCKLKAGQPCSSAGQCVSTYCVDGVCCGTSCEGVCLSCSNVRKGGGPDGVCAATAGGVDPDDDCAPDTVSACGLDGECNGAGGCRFRATGTTCGPTSCNGNLVQGKVCNGAGGCVDEPGASCAPYQCVGSACKIPCEADWDCVPGYFCDAGTCKAKGVNGAACGAPSHCQSGLCVDSVCCNLTCAGACQACTATKKGSGVDGECGPIVQGFDPDDECTAQSATSCGTTGTCSGTGACAFWELGTTCGSSCTGSTQTNRTCNGLGSCQASSVVACDPYLCAGLSSCKTSCASNADCIAGAYCDASTYTCQPDKSNGISCTSASQCQSGHCVDAVCCNDACNASCAACTAAKKGSGSNGVCGAVALGTDPDSECATQPASTCGTQGTCGVGGCQLYPPGYECGAPTCSSGTRTTLTCNGSGTCSSKSDTCAPYACNGSACYTTCSADTACLAGFWCDQSTGTCRADLALGGACSRADQCSSGNCVDGKCCDTACAGPCQACTNAKKGGGSDGVCGNIIKGTDPDIECSDQGATTCGTNGTCGGNGACDYYAAGTPCGTSTCSSDMQTGFACNGIGTCSPSTSTPCSPYRCAGNACGMSCTTDAACTSSYWCSSSDSKCHADQPNGSACTANSQCATGNCVDEVCCDTACQGTCMACTAAKKGKGSDGTCGNIVLGDDPDDECFDEGAGSCRANGTCSGMGSCALYSAGTACGLTTCANDSQAGQACNGSGTCLASSVTNCAPYRCSGNACGTTCMDDSGCAPSYWCDLANKTCRPDQDLGSACTAASQCSSGICVDGFCCDTACDGTCVACSAAKKGSGADGTCGPVVANSDPDNECTSTAAVTCGTSGSCDGKGGCASWAAGTACGATTCADGVQVGKACDGGGTCADAQTSLCTPYLCAGSACGTVCVDDSGCVESHFCAASGLCQPDKSNGAVCSSASECKSGHCIDGFCCDTACPQKCYACSAEKKAQGTDGSCGPIAVKTDPDNECIDSGQASCQADGFCDGNGECSVYAAGAPCGPTTCSNGVQSGQSCNGLGSCVSSSSTSCAPLTCKGPACATSCAEDADCAGLSYCDVSDSTCKPYKALGAACTSGSQCQSGNCADSVCCDTACSGACQACTNAKKGTGADGVCANVAADTDPDGDCDAVDPTSCGRNGSCDGAGECSLYAHGVSCGVSSCQGNVAKGAICNGLGTCVSDSGGADCSPYVCEGSGCAQPCATDAHCVSGNFCAQSACKPKGDTGQDCASDDQCASGICADSVCCDNECAGQCEACNLAGAEGSCTAVTGTPRGTRPACGGQGDCAAACDGVARAQCTFPGAAVLCEQTCSGDSLTVSSCDGKGQCVVGAASSCAPYRCAAEASGCRNSCADSSDCASGAKCNAQGQCVADGGAPSGSGGSDGGLGDSETPTPASAPPAEGDGGGCRIAVGASNHAAQALVLLLAVAGLRRRRQR